MRGLAIALSALLAVPAAGATWYAYGSYEPDTALDSPMFNYEDAPPIGSSRVYFNGYFTWGDPGNNGAFINPNVGVLHTNMDPPGPIYWEAILGVWRDCNGDGYVGMLETVVREYDARLLVDTTVCPPESGPRTSWNGAHNYNGWVTELIPIANMESSNADKRMWKDEAAMVWADTGRPDDAAAPPGTVCQARARGDAHTTGGILWQLDCQGHGIGVGENRVPVIRTFNDADAMLRTGLGFGEDPGQSSSPLNRPTFGSDDSAYSAVNLQDCEADPMLTTGDLPGADADNIPLLRPVPPNVVNPNPERWTIPGTLNHTGEAFYAPNGTYGGSSTSNCDYSDDAGQDFYRFLEGNVDVPPYDGKDAAWRNFRFQTASRGTLPANFVYGSGSAQAPTDFGLTPLGIECGPSSCWESGWFGGTATYLTPALDTRLDVVGGDVAWSIARAPWFTFYAHVGGATTQRGFTTPGGMGVYGAGQCGENDSGTHNGWNCDAAAWYRRSDGSYPPSPRPLARVGQSYNLRDVDCYDGSLPGLGVGTSPGYWGDAPCLR